MGYRARHPILSAQVAATVSRRAGWRIAVRDPAAQRDREVIRFSTGWMWVLQPLVDLLATAAAVQNSRCQDRFAPRPVRAPGAPAATFKILVCRPVRAAMLVGGHVTSSRTRRAQSLSRGLLVASAVEVDNSGVAVAGSAPSPPGRVAAAPKPAADSSAMNKAAGAGRRRRDNQGLPVGAGVGLCRSRLARLRLRRARRLSGRRIRTGRTGTGARVLRHHVLPGECGSRPLRPISAHLPEARHDQAVRRYTTGMPKSHRQDRPVQP